MPYTRVHRLLRILTLIQSQRGWNAARLAAECDVDERTIYRDLEELEGVGVPYFFDQPSNGYRVRADFFLPPIQMTPEEALSLIALAEDVAGREQIPFLRAAARAVAKIEAQLPAPLRAEARAATDRIAIQTAAAAPPDGYADVYERVRAAIAARRALECVYDSAASSPASALESAPEDAPDDAAGAPADSSESFILRPYCLFFSVRAWYVVGHHAGRNALRSLKLSRFSALKQTDLAYDIPPDFSLETYLGHAWRMINGDPEHDVEIHFDPEFAPTMSDTLWHRTQKIETHDDGSATFRCRVAGLDEIVWWVLAMGPHCTVKSPPALRGLVARLASETAALYAPSRA